MKTTIAFLLVFCLAVIVPGCIGSTSSGGGSTDDGDSGDDSTESGDDSTGFTISGTVDSLTVSSLGLKGEETAGTITDVVAVSPEAGNRRPPGLRDGGTTLEAWR